MTIVRAFAIPRRRRRPSVWRREVLSCRPNMLGFRSIISVTRAGEGCVAVVADNLECDGRFAELLSSFDSRLLESEGVCAYGLWPDLSLAYLSPGWFRFAAANGGEPEISMRWRVGSDVLSGIRGPLRGFFEAGYRRCLTDNYPWEHIYECLSPERFRTFQMMAYPLEASRGLLVVHSLSFEQAIPVAAQKSGKSAEHGRYVDGAGLYHQCSYCRRMRRTDEPEIWDRVSEWVRRPPTNTSHGICEGCFGHYCPTVEREAAFHLPRTTSTPR